MNLHERTLSVLACRVSELEAVLPCAAVRRVAGGWAPLVQFLSPTEESEDSLCLLALLCGPVPAGSQVISATL